MDWLLAPIDATRDHAINPLASWHGRVMVLGWGVLAPLAILIARYFKVMPGQDWPRVLDNPFWWRCHWVGQGTVGILTLLGLGLIWGPSPVNGLHGILGYGLIGMLAAQIVGALLRGQKGGPDTRGDHYLMPRRRVAFEWGHKLVGYGAMVLSVAVILLGLWAANAPVWMWLAICLWWAALVGMAAILQRQGRAIDTYQAIWGPDAVHPGNQRKPIGWGITRQ